MADTCTTCVKARPKWARWFYIYPDILPPGRLEPIAIYCESCVPVEHSAKRLAARQARKSAR
jgi:hypothetical protein